VKVTGVCCGHDTNTGNAIQTACHRLCGATA
jgi:hypothetical protein